MPFLDFGYYKKCSYKKNNNFMISPYSTYKPLERASLSASLTIEAAIVIPLVTFFAIFMCSPLFIMNSDLILRDKMMNCAFKLSEYYFILAKSEDTEFVKENKELSELAASGISIAYANNYIIDDAFSEYLHKSVIYNEKSFSFALSSISAKESDINLTAICRTNMRLPFRLPVFQFIHRCYIRGFNGQSITESDYEAVRVYITKYGSVYHKTKECTYLYNVYAIDMEWENYVNYKGDIEYMNRAYKYCRRCLSLYNSSTECVYMAIGADTYHYSLECPTLKRTVYSTNIDTISDDYVPCSRCY